MRNLKKVTVNVSCAKWWFLALILVSQGTWAREVDNYMAWGVDLEDAGPRIDGYMRERLGEAIKLDKVRSKELPDEIDPKSNAKPVDWYLSCSGTVERLMREAFYRPTYQLIEEFVDEGTGIDIYPRRPTTEDWEERVRLGETPDNGYMTNDEYIDYSIVRSSPLNVPMARVANMHGVYSGSDKLGHFTSWGVRYLKKYVKLREKGMSREEAFLEVMEHGYKSEESVVGMMFTGVFSRGDLEANYQGMRFARSLCLPDSEIRLEYDGDAWALLNLDKLTMAAWIDPNWDESYLNSIFSGKKWEEDVTQVFEQRQVCDLLDTDWVIDQRRHYDQTTAESHSLTYGDTWIPENFEGMDVAEHSLDHYCSSRDLALMSPPSSGNPLPRRDDEWRYSVAFPMIWMPDIEGKIRGEESFDFQVGFDDILDSLSFGMMFELYANRGPFGLAFKTNYMTVEDENTRSSILNTKVETELDMGVNDLLAQFRVHDKMRLTLGVRHVLAKMTLDIKSTIRDRDLIDRKVTVTDDNLFDYMIGVNIDHWHSDRWGFMLNADVAVAGDNDRDYSVEVRALYRISELNNLWFGWRYLDIGNDTIIDGENYEIDMIQTGPTLGWAFTF
jgi:hypothetical protein